MTITAKEAAGLTELAEQQAAGLVELAAASPTASPAKRAVRSTGQGAVGYVLVDVAKAFDWLGSEHWTAKQAAERWPALTAVVVTFAAVAHNVVPAVGRFIAAWWTARHPAVV